MNKKFKILSAIAVLAAFGGTSAMAFGCSGESNSNAGSTHSHSYGEYSTVLASTCTSQGYKQATCSCGDVDYQLLDVDSEAHSYGAYVVTTQPTATTKGTATRTCAYNAAHTDTLELPVISDESYTSTTEGSVTTYTLKSDTSVSFSVAAAADEHEHSYTWEVVRAATCTDKGYKKGTCAADNTVVYEEIAVDSTAHKYGAYRVTTAPTSTTEGVASRTCIYCNETETKTLPVISEANYSSVANENGSTTYTLTSDESVSFTVSASGEIEESHTHAYIWSDGVAATCTSKGYKIGVCAADGATAYEAVDINSEAHLYGDYTVTTVPTATEKGVATRKCVYCGATDTLELPVISDDNYTTTTADGLTTYTLKSDTSVSFSVAENVHVHDYSVAGEVIQAATCSYAGIQEYSCATDGETIEKSIAIDSEAHSYGAWQVVTAPTSTRKGVIARYCAHNEAHYQLAVVPALSDSGYTTAVKSEETSTSAAVKTYTVTATVNGEEAEVSFDMADAAGSVSTAVNIAVANADKVIASDVSIKDNSTKVTTSFSTEVTPSSYIDESGDAVSTTAVNVSYNGNEYWFEGSIYGDIVGYYKSTDSTGAAIYSPLSSTDSVYITFANGYTYAMTNAGLGSSGAAYANSPEELLNKLYALAAEKAYTDLTETVDKENGKYSFAFGYFYEADQVFSEITVTFTVNADSALQTLSISVQTVGQMDDDHDGWQKNASTGYYSISNRSSSAKVYPLKNEKTYSLSVEQRTANCQVIPVNADNYLIRSVTFTNAADSTSVSSGDTVTVTYDGAQFRVDLTAVLNPEAALDEYDKLKLYLVTTDGSGNEVETALTALTSDTSKYVYSGGVSTGVLQDSFIGVNGGYSLYDDDNNRVHNVWVTIDADKFNALVNAADGEDVTYKIRIRSTLTSTDVIIKPTYATLTEFTVKYAGEAVTEDAIDVYADNYSNYVSVSVNECAMYSDNFTLAVTAPEGYTVGEPTKSDNITTYTLTNTSDETKNGTLTLLWTGNTFRVKTDVTGEFTLTLTSAQDSSFSKTVTFNVKEATSIIVSSVYDYLKQYWNDNSNKAYVGVWSGSVPTGLTSVTINASTGLSTLSTKNTIKTVTMGVTSLTKTDGTLSGAYYITDGSVTDEWSFTCTDTAFTNTRLSTTSSPKGTGIMLGVATGYEKGIVVTGAQTLGVTTGTTSELKAAGSDLNSAITFIRIPSGSSTGTTATSIWQDSDYTIPNDKAHNSSTPNTNMWDVYKLTDIVVYGDVTDLTDYVYSGSAWVENTEGKASAIKTTTTYPGETIYLNAKVDASAYTTTPVSYKVLSSDGTELYYYNAQTDTVVTNTGVVTMSRTTEQIGGEYAYALTATTGGTYTVTFIAHGVENTETQVLETTTVDIKTTSDVSDVTAYVGSDVKSSSASEYTAVETGAEIVAGTVTVYSTEKVYFWAEIDEDAPRGTTIVASVSGGAGADYATVTDITEESTSVYPSSYKQEFVFTATRGGTYTVTLTAYDADGNATEVVETLTINVTLSHAVTAEEWTAFLSDKTLFTYDETAGTYTYVPDIDCTGYDSTVYPVVITPSADGKSGTITTTSPVTSSGSAGGYNLSYTYTIDKTYGVEIKLVSYTPVQLEWTGTAIEANEFAMNMNDFTEYTSVTTSSAKAVSISLSLDHTSFIITGRNSGVTAGIYHTYTQAIYSETQAKFNVGYEMAETADYASDSYVANSGTISLESKDWASGSLQLYLQPLDSGATIQSVTCVNSESAAVTITVGETSNDVTAYSLSNLTKGTYTVTVTASNGKTFTFKVTVTGDTVAAYQEVAASASETTDSLTAITSGGSVSATTADWADGKTVYLHVSSLFNAAAITSVKCYNGETEITEGFAWDSNTGVASLGSVAAGTYTIKVVNALETLEYTVTVTGDSLSATYAKATSAPTTWSGTAVSGAIIASVGDTVYFSFAKVYGDVTVSSVSDGTNTLTATTIGDTSVYAFTPAAAGGYTITATASDGSKLEIIVGIPYTLYTSFKTAVAGISGVSVSDDGLTYTYTTAGKFCYNASADKGKTKVTIVFDGYSGGTITLTNNNSSYASRWNQYKFEVVEGKLVFTFVKSSDAKGNESEEEITKTAYYAWLDLDSCNKGTLKIIGYYNSTGATLCTFAVS